MSALAMVTAQAEQLKEVLARLDLQKLVLDQHAAVSESAANGNFTYVNDKFCQLSGYSREELIGKSHNIVNADVHPPEFWEAMHNAVKTGGVWQSEVCNRRKDGSYFWLVQSIAAARDDSGELIGYIDIGADITETKRLHAKMVRKGRLEQLGQLTATVAHEIRNPLGAIKTSTHLIERKVRDSNLGLEKALERINNGIARCDQIITELLDFARSKSLHIRPTKVDHWLRATVKEEAKGIPESVTVKFSPGLGDLVTAFDPDRMRHVISNLISNAAEAMIGEAKDGCHSGSKKPTISLATHAVDGNIEITVKDNGPGIAEDVMAKILEPLFTTKSFGVGLGLPVVDKILEQHGGGLKAHSAPGCGATFTAWFPITQNENSGG